MFSRVFKRHAAFVCSWTQSHARLCCAGAPGFHVRGRKGVWRRHDGIIKLIDSFILQVDPSVCGLPAFALTRESCTAARRSSCPAQSFISWWRDDGADGTIPCVHWRAREGLAEDLQGGELRGASPHRFSVSWNAFGAHSRPGLDGSKGGFHIGKTVKVSKLCLPEHGHLRTRMETIAGYLAARYAADHFFREGADTEKAGDPDADAAGAA